MFFARTVRSVNFLHFLCKLWLNDASYERNDHSRWDLVCSRKKLLLPSPCVLFTFLETDNLISVFCLTSENAVFQNLSEHLVSDFLYYDMCGLFVNIQYQDIKTLCLFHRKVHHHLILEKNETSLTIILVFICYHVDVVFCLSTCFVTHLYNAKFPRCNSYVSPVFLKICPILLFWNVTDCHKFSRQQFNACNSSEIFFLCILEWKWICPSGLKSCK